LGKLLLRALIEACEKLGRKQMLAVVGDSNNAASIGLHQSFGFRKVRRV
jgi:phosphinothricin acetyltransferase